MYASQIDSHSFSFQVSGSLWRDALVMVDMETNSLWSHITGESIFGEMENKVLNLFPSSLTTFAQFKKNYPNGKLLKKSEKGESGSGYKNYFANREKLGMFGRVDNFKRLKGKDKVVGIRIGFKQGAVSEKYLYQNQFAILDNFEHAVLVTYDSAGNSFSAFSLADLTDEAILKINLTGQTITTSNQDLGWNAQTGNSRSGKIANLQPLPLTRSFWFAWASFFPETELIN